MPFGKPNIPKGTPMPTPAQIEANRRNALKSTGPRTPEGKSASSRNALKHGLASISPHSFLAIEDRGAFERMLHGYILKYQPAHADEVDLLTDAVFCKWRQQRLWNVEAQVIEMAVAENQPDLQTKLPKASVAAHVAHAVTQSAERSQLNRRYEAQLHRQYLRNLKELRDLQSARLGDPPTLDLLYPPDAAPLPSPQPICPPVSPNEANSFPKPPSSPPPPKDPWAA